MGCELEGADRAQRAAASRPVPFAHAPAGQLTVMAEWRRLWNAITDASQRRWWRATVFIILPLYLVLTFTGAGPGWLMALMGVAWLSLLAAVWATAITSYRRERRRRDSARQGGCNC